MLISMQSIGDWAGANLVQGKFVEGREILEARHVVKCGKNIEKSASGLRG